MMPSQDQSSRENLARAFGSRLQSLRTQRDLSVAELESRYGVSGVEDLEAARVEPRPADIVAVWRPSVTVAGERN